MLGQSQAPTHCRRDAIQFEADSVFALLEFIHESIALADERFDWLRVADETFPTVGAVDLLQLVAAKVALYARSVKQRGGKKERCFKILSSKSGNQMMMLEKLGSFIIHRALMRWIRVTYLQKT